MTDQAKKEDRTIVLGMAHENSEAGKARLSLHQAAVDAVAKADVAAAFAAYESAIQDRSNIEEAMLTVSGMVGEERFKEIEKLEPVRAMREVALAAISLARDIAINGRKVG